MQIHVAKHGKQSGPYAVEQVQEMVRNGLLASTDLGWHDAMKEWAPLHTIRELGLPPPTGVGGFSADLAASGPAIGAGGPPADRVKRLVATIIDGVASGILVWACFGAGIFAGAGLGALPAFGIGFVMFGLALLGLFLVQTYLLATRGQTIGKIAMGIRIVKFEDGSNPGFVKAVLLRSWLWFVLGIIPVIGFLISLVDVLFIFRDDQRCLHDHVAGTYVIPVQPGA